MLTRRRMLLTTGAFALFALAVVVAAPLVGSVKIDPFHAWAGALAWLRAPAAAAQSNMDADILFTMRLPRIALAFLIGASLGVVGAAFQAMLRNPLATPETLGVASGGSLGAVVAMLAPAIFPRIGFSWGPFSHVQLFAFGGALLAISIIYWLARRGGRVPTLELLLAGVTMSIIFSALMLAVTYFASPFMLVNMTRWLMGGLDVASWRSVAGVWTLAVPGITALLLMARGYDQISFGEELAQGRGVNVARLQKLSFIFGSLAVAAVVAVAGPIGFVGLIVPHTVRRMTGPDHRLLLPCVFFAGGGFLVLCDTFARTVIAPTELPVGIITALLGGPFFIYLLVRGKK